MTVINVSEGIESPIQSSDYISYSDTNYDELNSSSIEQVWCVADTGLELILIGCIYRAKIIQERGVTASISEHKRRDDEINKVIRFANKLVKKGIFQGVILAGDFNYGELTWNELLEPEVIIESEPSNRFLETLNECFLSQNVFFKTSGGHETDKYIGSCHN